MALDWLGNKALYNLGVDGLSIKAPLFWLLLN